MFVIVKRSESVPSFFRSNSSGTEAESERATSI